MLEICTESFKETFLQSNSIYQYMDTKYFVYSYYILSQTLYTFNHVCFVIRIILNQFKIDIPQYFVMSY